MAKKKAAKKKASKKAGSNKKANIKTPLGRKSKLDPLDKKTLGLIEKTAERVQKKILARVLPELKFPVRSLSNVKYDKKVGYFELGRGDRKSVV